MTADKPAVTIELFAHPRNFGECRGCRRPIVWRETIRGKWIAFDTNPDVVRRYQSAGNGRLIEEVIPDAPHWRTCPVAGTFKQQTPKPAAAGSRKGGEDTPWLPL